VQGGNGHPGLQGGGPEKNNRKKRRAEERHKGLLTKKISALNLVTLVINALFR
jgi:hypothetical protein